MVRVWALSWARSRAEQSGHGIPPDSNAAALCSGPPKIIIVRAPLLWSGVHAHHRGKEPLRVEPAWSGNGSAFFEPAGTATAPRRQGCGKDCPPVGTAGAVVTLTPPMSFWNKAASSSPMMPMHHQTMRRSTADPEFYSVEPGRATCAEVACANVTWNISCAIGARTGPVNQCSLTSNSSAQTRQKRRSGHR